MKRTCIAAAILLVTLPGTPPARAGLWGRGKITAAWSGKPITMEANTADWTACEIYEDSGFGFKALNDGENLYLSISAHETGAGQILKGTIHQSVSIWFLEGKKRSWGVKLPFGGPAGAPYTNSEPQELPGPLLITSSGVVISTGILPENVKFHGDIADRLPAYELKVPLSLLTSSGGRIPIDFVTAYDSPGQEEEIKEKYNEAAKKSRLRAQSGDPSGDIRQNGSGPEMAPAGGMMSGGGGRAHGAHGGMGGGRRGGPRGGAHQVSEPPEPAAIQLAVVLAVKP